MKADYPPPILYTSVVDPVGSSSLPGLVFSTITSLLTYRYRVATSAAAISSPPGLVFLTIRLSLTSSRHPVTTTATVTFIAMGASASRATYSTSHAVRSSGSGPCAPIIISTVAIVSSLRYWLSAQMATNFVQGEGCKIGPPNGRRRASAGGAEGKGTKRNTGPDAGATASPPLADFPVGT